MVQENEAWPHRPGTPFHTVLDCIPVEGAIGYIELKERTGLAERPFDDALKALEGLGLIGVNQSATEKFYWKVGQQPRKAWYTVDEAASHMAVSKRTVQHLIRDGQLTAYRVGRGGHRRIKFEDLDSAMIRDDGEEIAPMTAKGDPVLADLWDNDQDSVYDRL